MSFEDFYTNNFVVGVGLTALALVSLRPYWRKEIPPGGVWKSLTYVDEDDVTIVISSVGFLLAGIFLILKFLYDFLT